MNISSFLFLTTSLLLETEKVNLMTQITDTFNSPLNRLEWVMQCSLCETIHGPWIYFLISYCMWAGLNRNVFWFLFFIYIHYRNSSWPSPIRFTYSYTISSTIFCRQYNHLTSLSMSFQLPWLLESLTALTDTVVCMLVYVYVHTLLLQTRTTARIKTNGKALPCIILVGTDVVEQNFIINHLCLFAGSLRAKSLFLKWLHFSRN